MPRFPALLPFLVAASLPSCGGASTEAPRCVPGKVESCPCDGAGYGTQSCAEDGTWGPCQGCLAADGTVFPDGSGPDGGGGPDGTAPDTPWIVPDVPGHDVTVLDVPAGDTVPSASCDPCGYGSLVGVVCAPNQLTLVPNAQVTVDVVDCDGEPRRYQTFTDKDGAYSFPSLPCGLHEVAARSGSFQISYRVEIATGETTDLTKVGARCFEAEQVKAAVFWGQWDRLQELLLALGIQFQFFNFETEFFNDTPPKDIEAFQVLTDPARLAAYDLLFFDCGSAAIRWVSGYPEIRQNLRNFVLAGGSMYASDLAWEYVEGAFPDAIRFHGTNELPSIGMDPNGPQVVKGQQNVVARILDPVLAAYLGQGQFVAHYGAGPLILVDSAAPGTTVHAAGKVMMENPKYGQFLQPEYIESPEGPFVLSFSPAQGAGNVVYTTFHNDEQADTLMLKLLHYLVFQL